MCKCHRGVWGTFERLSEIGSGSFGNAYLCRHRLMREERAVKVILKGQNNASHTEIEREIQMLRQLDHPHVVRLYEWYEDGHRVYLVMEALKGGTLQAASKELQQQTLALRDEWIRKVIRQILEAMAYCHSLQIVHKDLKHENIMLIRKDSSFQNPFAVIIDLGAAMMVSQAKEGAMADRNAIGTPATMAPEVWIDRFGPKSDVWSVGCILFELLAGKLPFVLHRLKREAWVALHRRGPDWNFIRASSNVGRELCATMLTFHETMRPTMAGCLGHRWFNTDVPEVNNTVLPDPTTPILEFCRGSDVRRGLIFALAVRLPMRRAQVIVDMFKSIDLDGDGKISAAEFRATLGRTWPQNAASVQEVFNILDTDRDGVLSFTEFAAGVLLAFRDTLSERFRALFREYDLDGDGTISMQQAEDLLAVAGPVDKHQRAALLGSGTCNRGSDFRCEALYTNLFYDGGLLRSQP